MSHEHEHASANGALASRWYVWAAAAILAFYLWAEHRAHLYGALPWVLILLCPLMHVFMGHGGHRHGGRSRDEKGA